MDRINKISSIIFYVLGGISIILAGLFYFGGDAPETIGTSLPEKRFMSVFLMWGIILFGVAALITIIYSAVNALGNLKSAKGFLFVLIGVAVLLVISYVLADSDPLPNLNMENPPSPTVLKLVGTGLIATGIIAAGTVLTIIATEVIRAFK